MKIGKKSVIVTIGVLLVTAGVCVYFNSSAKNNVKGGRPQNAQTLLTVQTEVATIGTLHDYIATNGEIEAQNSVAVYPDMGGKIVSTSVLLGDNVRRGDVIARIDPSEPGARYALSPVLAPISGSIISTPLKTGTTVTTSSTITTIGDIRDLQISAKIPERYTAVLKIGLKANIILPAYPDVIFEATVTRVSPVVDTSSRTKEIILKFDEADDRLNAGMFANVTLFTLDYSDCIIITNNAIVAKNDKSYVYVIKSGTENVVEQRQIEIGKAVNGVSQIVSGVKEGERIVVAGTQSLSDGSTVRDIANPSSSNAATANPNAQGGRPTGGNK